MILSLSIARYTRTSWSLSSWRSAGDMARSWLGVSEVNSAVTVSAGAPWSQ
jgi:hypothetical protein